ncbi:hypothetical protein AB0J52_10835, partial [Spirillospora sp. NPDC049652]
MSSNQGGTSPAPPSHPVETSAEHRPSERAALSGDGPEVPGNDPGRSEPFGPRPAGSGVGGGGASGGGKASKKLMGRVLGIPSPLLIAGAAAVAIALTAAAFMLTGDDSGKKRRPIAKPRVTAPWATAARQRLLAA